MLQHSNDQSVVPQRVVVLGSAGFVAQAAIKAIRNSGGEVVELPRSELDLCADGADKKLSEILQPTDCLLFVSAKAPVKNADMLIENIRMSQAVCSALGTNPVDHVIYVSSDAVYTDSPDPLDENSPKAPTALHGIMHLTREIMLTEVCGDAVPLGIIRPTLIYGKDDPHNGYGPNRFQRLAAAGDEITLFGEGEELRDHVDVEDVGQLISLMALHRSSGSLNAATGVVASFRELAEYISSQQKNPVKVKGTVRNGPMPHDGYRPFDPAATSKSFPSFSYNSWKDYYKTDG